MALIISDNKAVESRLETLISILRKRGGCYFHEALTIKCENNQFSLHGYNAIGKGECCIKLPKECFVDMGGVHLKANDQDDLVISKMDNTLNADQQQVAELIIEIYNQTQKYKDYTKFSHLNLYEHNPALVADIYLGQKKDVFDTYVTNKDKGLLEAFLKVRTFAFPGASGKKSPHIAPIMEYFNHDYRAGDILAYVEPPDQSQHKGMIAFASNPLENNELLISYNEMDSRQLFTLEAYNDAAGAHVLSIPFKCDLPGKIKFSTGASPDKLLDEGPVEALEGLHMFAPQFRYLDREIQTHFIYIPQKQAPFALRRVLKYIFGAQIADQNAVNILTLTAEHIIIRRNLQYYEGLLSRLENLQDKEGIQHIVKDVQTMCDIQIEKIKAYPFFEKAMSFQSKFK